MANWELRTVNYSAQTLEDNPDFDKYEHFNDLLRNMFSRDCQFGTFLMELRNVKIPEINDNKIFMVKIRCSGESKTIYVGSPNTIYGDQRESI